MGMDPAIVRAEGLEKRFGSNLAVKDVSFTVNRGDIYGFIGRNGAGKTTVMRMLVALMRPDRGSVRLLTCQGRGVGFLPQNVRFDDNRSAADVLRFYARLRRADPAPALRELQETGLDLSKRARHLSPGQQRKLQLAVVTLGSPELLVLDEPTAGLDPPGVQQVRESILRLRGRGGTVFLSSHALAEMDTLCNTVAVIDEGRILYEGPCASVYELEVGAEEPRQALPPLSPFRARCSFADGRLYARVDRGEVPGLLGALHEGGVPVYAVRRLGLEMFYNSIVKGGA
jgi:ABC-type multidrug transport system ATPase subunit